MLFDFPPSDVMAFIRRIYGNARLYVTPDAYQANFGAAVTAAGLYTQSFQIPSNADFVCLGVAYYPEVGTGTLNGSFITLTNSSTGDQFDASPMPLATWDVGATEQKKTPVYPRFLGGNTSVTANLQADGSFNEISVQLHGVLIRRL